MDTELANDRTYLAWFRTGIALFGLGFVVAKIALIVEPDTTGVSNERLYTGVGALIVLSGAALMVVGYFQHAAVWRIVIGQTTRHRPRWPRTITAVAVAGSVLLCALIIATT